MKATDLMIGDWVQSFGEPHKIIGIRTDTPYAYIKTDMSDTWYEFGMKDLADGISITPEILEKNYGKETRVGISDNPCWGELGAMWITMLWKCENSFWLEVRNTEGGFVKKHIRYVHELQHAIRLCRIEKEIEL